MEFRGTFFQNNSTTHEFPAINKYGCLFNYGYFSSTFFSSSFGLDNFKINLKMTLTLYFSSPIGSDNSIYKM